MIGFIFPFIFKSSTLLQLVRKKNYTGKHFLKLNNLIIFFQNGNVHFQALHKPLVIFKECYETVGYENPRQVDGVELGRKLTRENNFI